MYISNLIQKVRYYFVIGLSKHIYKTTLNATTLSHACEPSHAMVLHVFNYQLIYDLLKRQTGVLSVTILYQD